MRMINFSYTRWGQQTRKIPLQESSVSPASGEACLSVLPLLLLLHAPSVGRAGGAGCTPVRGDCLPFPHRNGDQVFQNNTQVTGSIWAIYKYVRCWEWWSGPWGSLDFSAVPFILHFLTQFWQNLLQSDAWVLSWACQRVGLRHSRLMQVWMSLIQGGHWWEKRQVPATGTKHALRNIVLCTLIYSCSKFLMIGFGIAMEPRTSLMGEMLMNRKNYSSKCIITEYELEEKEHFMCV